MTLLSIASVNCYQQSECAAFMRSREKFGNLSNMTSGFPIDVNGIRFQSSEGLYQSFKFPHDPQRQRDIASAGSGMDAKRIAYLPGCRPHPSWDDFRVDAMALTLAMKLLQHPGKFGAALTETSGLIIVEKSYRDQFWGAKPICAQLVGANVLGKLLQILADRLMTTTNPDQAAQHLISQADTSKLQIDRRPLTPQ